jgi:hypothetical protein
MTDDYDLPVTTDTPDDVRSGEDGSAYDLPAEDDPAEPDTEEPE